MKQRLRISDIAVVDIQLLKRRVNMPRGCEEAREKEGGKSWQEREVARLGTFSGEQLLESAPLWWEVGNPQAQCQHQ